ncbi:hypothetical protein Tco_0886726, partial [Tanacetum coccineum]
RIRRIGNWSNTFSCEVQALIRRISFVGYGAKSTETSKGTSKSQPKSIVKSAQAEETVFEAGDTQEPHNQGQDTDWNLRKSIDSRPPQTWISKISQAEKPPLSFDELMITPINFSTYVMNHLKIDKLTQEHLVGPTFNLSKGHAKKRNIHLILASHYGRQVVPVDYFINNDLEYLRGGSLSTKYTTSTTKTKIAKYDILGIVDMVPSLWSPVKKFKECNFPRLYLHDIEDMMLLLVQKKLSNLERDVIFNLDVALRMFTRRIIILKRVEDLQLGVKSYQKKLNITKLETYRSDISKRTPYNNPQGIIYVDKYKRNRLMRSDELYKFSDGKILIN